MYAQATSGTLGQMAQKTAAPMFSNDYVSVDLIPARTSEGHEYQHTRVHSGSGFGAIVVPYYQQGATFVGMVHQHRPVLDCASLEFPRGRTQNLCSTEALRELVEETGIRTKRPDAIKYLGTLHPDTGLLSTEVAVWSLHVPPGDAPKGYVEPISGARLEWVRFGSILDRVGRAEITCAMTLAAAMIFQSKNPMMMLNAELRPETKP